MFGFAPFGYLAFGDEGSPTLNIAVNNATESQTTTSATITTNNSIAVNNATESQTTTSPQIINPVNINSANHSQTVTNPLKTLWDPANSQSEMVFTQGNLQVRGNLSSWQTALANIAHSITVGGYFETVATIPSFAMVGVGNLNTPHGTANYGGETSASIVATSDALIRRDGGTYGSPIGSYVTNDTISVFVKNGQIWWANNGVWGGDPSAGTGGTSLETIGAYVVPIVSTVGGGVWTANFGNSAFTYAIPTGGQSWDTYQAPARTVTSNSATQSQTTTSATIATNNSIAVNNATESQTTTSATIATNNSIAVNNATESQTTTSATITSSNSIVVNSTTESQAATSATIATNNSIVVNNATESQTTTSATIATNNSIAVNVATQSQIASLANVSTLNIISPINAEQTNVSDSPTIISKYIIIPASANENNFSTSPIIIPNDVIVPNNSTQDNLAESALVASVINVNEAIQDQISTQSNLVFQINVIDTPIDRIIHLLELSSRALELSGINDNFGLTTQNQVITLSEMSRVI